MLAAAASALASLRLGITTCAPAPASAFAVSSPSPPLAPVTTATRPAWSGMSAVVQLMAIDRIVQGVPEITLDANLFGRSEERRVGKEGVSTCRSRWAPDH